MSKIIGVTVGTSMPRPDWNQKDPEKANYIKNKPDDVEGVSDERIQSAVNKHLAEHPPAGGATAEQAAQIEANAKAIEELQEAPPGEPGKDGITPHIGENGNWYIGDTDTGKPSRGADGSPGQDGGPGKDGTSATHTWNGTTLTVTSASGTSSADLVGPAGNPGTNGVSPTVTVSKSGKVTTVKITDAAGTKTATINDGADGGKGDPGATGRRGNSILKVTTAPTAESSTVDGYSYQYKFLLSKVLSESKASEVLVGDVIKYSYYEYSVGYVGATYAFAYTRTSIRGSNGTSVTVSSVSESAADGGDNVVNFSDGKSLTVKNGTQGSPGYTPVRGTDYWTPTDKAEIKEYISSEIGEQGQTSTEYAESIEWLNENGDTSKLYVLPDGYIYAFTSGGTQEVFTDVLKDVGYKENHRINSSGGIVEWTASEADATGYIPVKPGDVIRVKNMPIPSAYTGGVYWNGAGAYTADKTFIKKVVLLSSSVDQASQIEQVEEDGNIVQFTITSEFGDNVAFIVINAKDITANSEVYVNSTFVSTDAWVNTGIAFVPTVETDSPPPYWLTELETKAEEIQIAMETAGRNKSAFLWYTDAHWQTNAKVSPRLLKYLIENTPMNKVNFGGDIVGDPATYNHDSVRYAYEWRKQIAGLRNHHSVYGNHDLNHWSTDVSKIAYALLLAPEESSDMVVGGDSCYYIDNPSEKTRYLYLSYLTSDHTAMTVQGAFIVDALKTTPDGWHIVAIAHRWFQYTSASAPTVGNVPNYEKEILQVFDEYNARGSHTTSNYFSAQNFTDGKGKVEFCIGGHIHVDHSFTTTGGIPVILTASDTNQERSGDETEDCGTVGTITESAVFGIVADYTNGKITVVGIGRGGSREITL